MSLYNDYCASLGSARNFAVNGYLQLLAPYIKDIENASSTNSVLSKYCNKLITIAQRKDFVLNGDLTAEFVQLFGEAHFAALCCDRSISLNIFPKQKNTKTPDFFHASSKQKLYFEVKTLSVVNGGRGINNDLLKSLNAQIDVEQQLQQGKRVAIGESEMQPYADKPCQAGNTTAVISTLIDKTRQNIKSGQYLNGITFLVINLCLIPPTIIDNRTLRPGYCDDLMFPNVITGELWMLAFAQPGMLIFGHPEFEGKPCIEGIIQKYGILSEGEFVKISGLLCIVYPLGSEPQIFGLYRGSDYRKWMDAYPELITTLKSLTGSNWNDDTDSNGWQLAGK
jgi:hypothetical protein